jgi:hypothetical protein
MNTGITIPWIPLKARLPLSNIETGFVKSATTAALSFFLAAPLGLTGTTLCEHNGAADPATECWVPLEGPGVDAFPVVNDMGHDAWATDDNVPAFNPPIDNHLHYRFFLTPADISAALTSGWTLSVLLRVVDVPDDVDFAVYSGVTFGNLAFTLKFGAQADGDPIVSLHDLPPIALEGAGGGYHLYQMRYDPASASADLLVDGVERLSDYTGWTDDVLTPNVGWGAGGGPGTGQGNFAHVKFEIVPEPATGVITCLLLAIGAVVGRRLGIFKA